MSGHVQLALAAFALVAVIVLWVVAVECLEAWREQREQALIRAIRRHPAGSARHLRCPLPPAGWFCTRPAGHTGPCPAWPEPARGRGGRHARA